MQKMKTIFLESFHTEVNLLFLKEERKSDLKYGVINIQSFLIQHKGLHYET